ncbi:flagellar basal body rod protein FlgB [Fusibacter ferrireducens]|uniref:Flagellar basal body rod protein FlgB n=1 Tax=Fusibacter ferrireducens TaxID=2785058 RepID=A0ABR9ZMT3_9FIRM|nr:flagellar basal body rod protein FlgB [Fusibacter ferrireducens]MBF4691719.1 flagellar basal body rod protein FlgB [Fusibacter ferrireducens]
MFKSSFNYINLINKALDGSWMKNSAIASNIANVNTPGYKKETVSFEDALRTEMNLNTGVKMTKTDDRHLDPYNSGTIRTEKVYDTRYRVDGNNVDVDVENAELAKNTIYYNALVTEINGQYNRLKTALRINK